MQSHAYDASHHSNRHAVRMGCAAQVSGVARLVGVQRTVQKHGNLKSEPKYLACEESPIYMLSTFELFFVVLSLYWLLLWADYIAFFFLRVASRWLCSALIYALGSTNTYVAKGKPCCPPCPHTVPMYVRMYANTLSLIQSLELMRSATKVHLIMPSETSF